MFSTKRIFLIAYISINLISSLLAFNSAYGTWPQINKGETHLSKRLFYPAKDKESYRQAECAHPQGSDVSKQLGIANRHVWFLGLRIELGERLTSTGSPLGCTARHEHSYVIGGETRGRPRKFSSEASCGVHSSEQVTSLVWASGSKMLEGTNCETLSCIRFTVAFCIKCTIFKIFEPRWRKKTN